MVGLLDSDKALGMIRRLENAMRVLDADHLVNRRMQDEQSSAQFTDDPAQVMLLEIFQKLTLDTEFPSRQNYFGFTLRLNPRHRSIEKWTEVTGIARSSNRNYSLRLGNAMCRSQDSGPSQAVPNE